MSEYRLTALRFDQVLERDERGRVTKRKKYRRGDIVTGLGEKEITRLLAAGAIVPADQEETEEILAVVGAPVPPASVPVSTEPDAGVDGEPAVVVDESSVVVERPAQVAPKSVWVAYAVAQGLDRGEAEEQTKAELIARFGE